MPETKLLKIYLKLRKALQNNDIKTNDDKVLDCMLYIISCEHVYEEISKTNKITQHHIFKKTKEDKYESILGNLYTETEKNEGYHLKEILTEDEINTLIKSIKLNENQIDTLFKGLID